jgi:hypothetical protein
MCRLNRRREIMECLLNHEMKLFFPLVIFARGQVRIFS